MLWLILTFTTALGQEQRVKKTGKEGRDNGTELSGKSWKGKWRSTRASGAS